MGHWDIPGQSDDWFTPKKVFDALGCWFDVDVSAPITVYCKSEYVPCYNRIICNSLTREWNGFVWMNPPFGGRNGIEPWLDKFFEHRNGIALTPDRTSALWFWRAWAQADLVLFTRKIRFLRIDGSEGVSPSNGTALFACGPEGVAGLQRAAAAGFGILAKRPD